MYSKASITYVPPLALPGDAGAPVVNHSKSVDVSSAKVESSLPAAQPKVIVVSQAGVGTSHPSPVTCATPTASPTPAHLQSPGAPTVPVRNSSLPVGAPVKAAVQMATTAVRPTARATQRIVAPQLIVRPPQQQTTIQLPPGFTIPPGMVLVRTEMGQLVMVPQQALAQAQAQAQNNIAPRQAAPTTGPTFRVTTTQSPVTSQTIRPCPPVQAKVVSSSSPAGNTTLQVASPVSSFVPSP
ncbi:transcription initiation factor TFIID subunit 4-like [Arapaima gigas]